MKQRSDLDFIETLALNMLKEPIFLVENQYSHVAKNFVFELSYFLCEGAGS